MALLTRLPEPTNERDNEPAILRDPSLSSYREQLVEYAFLSELLQDGWLRRRQRVDVLRADVDGSGYDLALECGGVLRHVQLKSAVAGGRTASQSVNVRLCNAPSGCIVWVVLDRTTSGQLSLSFLVLGSLPGIPLDLAGRRVGRHTRADAHGEKKERPWIRKVPRSAFIPLRNAAELSDWLFGPPAMGDR
jgi:hypothetical protein